MKRIILSFIICCGLFNLIFAQDTILINFAKKTIKLPDIKRIKYIKERGFYIKIESINLNLFKVSVTSVDTILSKPQQTPAFGNFSLDAISKIIAGMGPKSSATTKEALKAEAKNECINKRMKYEENTTASFKYLIDSIIASIDNLKLEIYKIRLNSLKLDNPKEDHNFDTDIELTHVIKIRENISNLKTKIIQSKSEYEVFEAVRKDSIASNPVYAARDKSIKESYNNLLITLADALSSISADKTNELFSTIVLLENNTNNTYTSLPIQFTGEQAKVKISIIPRDEKYNLQSYYTQIVYPQKIPNYIVVGLSLYGSSLYDKAYSIVETKGTDTIYNIKKEENTSKGEIGIAALIHYGTILNENDTAKLGAHVSLGAGISISDKIKPRFLFGGGLSYGEKHKFTFDCGIIVGYVNELSSNWNLSQPYPIKPEDITVLKIGVGIFWSIGYVYQF